MVLEKSVPTLIGRNLRRLRAKRGLSQRGLANSAEVARQIIAGLERGYENQANPTMHVLERLAGTLGVPVSEFFVRAARREPRT